MNKRHFHGLILALPFLVAGCDQDEEKTSRQTPSATATQVDVTPSLGRITNGVIELRTLDGELLASGGTGTSGVASFTLPVGLDQPYVVSICGGPDASYFDEALLAAVPLAESDCLRAIVADAQRSAVAVTILTEAVARRLEALGSLADADAAAIATASELVRTRLAPELDDLLAPPDLVGSADDLLALPLSPAGLHALRLSLLARAAADLAAMRDETVAAPALETGKALAADLADGELDGRDAGAFIFSPVHDVHDLQERLQEALLSLADDAEALQVLAAYLEGADLLGAVVPAPGDELLSWRGTYHGYWQLGENVSLAKTYSSSFPQDYKDFLAQLVEGGPCALDVGYGSLSVAGLGFGYDRAMSQSPDEAGVRLFQRSREDTAQAPVYNFTFPVTSTVMLTTRSGALERATFSGYGDFPGFAFTATATCVMSTDE